MLGCGIGWDGTGGGRICAGRWIDGGVFVSGYVLFSRCGE